MTLLQHPSVSRTRAGFTLIELLVVIAIIAILVSLLGAGIFYAMSTAADAGAMVEINQFDEAVKAFKAKFNFYPPDRFRLYSSQAEYQTDIAGGYTWSNPALAQNSLSIINKMWPNIGAFGSTGVIGTNPKLAWADGINPFNSPLPNGNPYGNTIFVDLEGDQCLVFFLGGIPLNACSPSTTPQGPYSSNQPGFGSQGFSVNPKNPTQPPTPPGQNGPGRVGPFYTFTAARFMARPNSVKTPTNMVYGNPTVTPPSPLPAGTFLSYADYFSSTTDPTMQRPYIYFSANNRKNGYNAFPQAAGISYYIQLGANDQFNAGRMVTAYFQPLPLPIPAGNVPPVQLYQNPDTFQIISAGRDGYFNSVAAPIAIGNALYTSPFQWASNNTTFLWETKVGGRPVGGQDDVTDFSSSKLGISAQ